MESTLLERMEGLLRAEGFTHITRDSSSHSWTLSADKAGLRAVFHMTDQDEPSNHARPHDQVPAASDIRMKATLQGARARFSDQSGRAGQGSAYIKKETRKSK